jgi:hypothetical protein
MMREFRAINKIRSTRMGFQQSGCNAASITRDSPYKEQTSSDNPFVSPPDLIIRLEESWCTVDRKTLTLLVLDFRISDFHIPLKNLTVPGC